MPARSVVAAVALALLVAVATLLVLVLAGPVRSQGGAASWPGGIGAVVPGVRTDHMGSAACAGCHEKEAAAWAGSHHALAMAKAVPELVRGDFSGVSVDQLGSRGRFFREGDRFLVETDGRDGKPAVFAVSHTFGWEPLQQYLVTFPDGRIQALPWAWDTRPRKQGGQRWFHVYGDQPIPSADPLHWTRGQQNWNYMCAECHSTAVQKNFEPSANSFRTTYSEVSVGCESCHGAGREHIAWAGASPRPADPAKGFKASATPRLQPDWTADPTSGSPRAGSAPVVGGEVDTCARCHSRRSQLAEDWHPGRPLEATHMPVLLAEGLFEADGQMRDEIFNDHAFRQSRMHAKGVVCSDCHDPHSARLKAPGAEVCGQCHETPRFAAASHTGHAPGPGAPDCVACHMPARTYMVVDRRHDHSFRIPRPDLSARLGTPNACTDCHRDKPPAWAAEAVERWHGPDRKGYQTWAEAFTLSRRGDPAARDRLVALAADPAVPPVARATALGELTPLQTVATQDITRRALRDPAPLVRIAAARALAGRTRDERLSLLLPLAADPVLAVRAEAGRLLADVRASTLAGADQATLAAALGAFEATQRLIADRPEGRAGLATLFMQQGRMAEAEAELVAGLQADPTASALAVNLADLYRVTGRESAAEQVLRRVVSLTPQAAGPRHALGLSLVRQRRYDDALAQLARAAELEPSDARFAYVYGVALQSLGRQADSRAALERALVRQPFNPDLLNALLGDALRSGDMTTAADLAKRLAALRPDDPEIARLAARLGRP